VCLLRVCSYFPVICARCSPFLTTVLWTEGVIPAPRQTIRGPHLSALQPNREA